MLGQAITRISIGVLAFCGAAGGVAGLDYAISALGPAYVDSMENLSCPDAGALIKSPYGQGALSCSCSGDTYFDGAEPVDVTGRASTSFEGRAREVYCRSQSNSVCDCWAHVSSRPSNSSADE